MLRESCSVPTCSWIVQGADCWEADSRAEGFALRRCRRPQEVDSGRRLLHRHSQQHRQRYHLHRRRRHHRSLHRIRLAMINHVRK